VRMPSPAASGSVMLGVNESWNRTSAADLARSFEQAIG
jgi:hypothetical protein